MRPFAPSHWPACLRCLNGVVLMLCVVALPGCGGDTSVYFCSGGVEFCSSFREAVFEAGNPPQPAPALEVARKTPALIEEGLAADQLDSVLAASPELVGAWLLTSSLGLLVDAGDDESATRFFDEARYWLLYRDVPVSADPVLRAGLSTTVVVAEQADPAVAEAALELLARLDGAGVTIQAKPASTAQSADAERILAGLETETLDGSCCSAEVLAASAVQLCETLAGAEAELDSRVALACEAARAWLAALVR